MRIETDGYYTPKDIGDEDWVLACMYMTAQEIIENKLVANDYNGGDYDWITLPERKDGPKEYLVAAYGGLASELAYDSSTSTLTGMAYYTEAAYYDDEMLPADWRKILHIEAVGEAVKVFDEDA